MGKSSYRPRKNNGNKDGKIVNALRNKKERGNDKRYSQENLNDSDINIEVDSDNESSIAEERLIAINATSKVGDIDFANNIKEIGDLDCEYHVFIEDYVYTYIYQLAKAETAYECSGILLGDVYKDSKEIVVKGIIPIKMDKIKSDNEWIDSDCVEDLMDDKNQYFKEEDIIGWMHIQPGYGTMLTMKEIREHNSVFEGDGSVCLLVDPVNKIESVFVSIDNELKEQTGFCMYYERNESMQRYMLDHSFDKQAREEMKDTVVDQLREIGKVRKEEYNQRKNLNFAVMLVGTILIALTAIMVKHNNAKNNILDNPGAQGNNSVVNELQLNGDGTNQNEMDTNQNEGVLSGDLLNNESDTDVTENSTDVINDVEEQVDTDSEEETSGANKYELDHIHIIKEGETLANIAYDIFGNAEASIQIAEFNDLHDTDYIYIGQELKIPVIE